IYKATFDSLAPVVGELLFNGVTLFGGRPKVGKSWLTLLIAIAVATGKNLWGKLPVGRPGRVLYCALEEPPSRTSSRLKKLLPEPDPLLMNMEVIYRMKALLAGGAAELDAYLTARPADLVIIDTLAAVVQANGKRDAFRSDYAEVATIGEIARKHKTAILVV